MNTDSTVIEVGGFVVQNVTRSTTLSKDGKVITENIAPLNDFSQIMGSVMLLYAVLFVALAAIIAFLGWYYMKKKAETARLMIENNMSPAAFYGPGNERKSISNFLKFGIILIAIALSVCADAIFSSRGLFRYSGAAFLFFIGAALVVIHILNSRQK